MGIPYQVLIFGQIYDVVRNPATVSEAGNVIGLFDYDARRIYISNDVAIDAQLESFYHEVVHAILSHSGLTNLLDEKMEEAVCSALATGLLRFVSDNDQLPRSVTRNGKVEE